MKRQFMSPGDLVMDHELGQHGIITEARVCRHYPDTEDEVLAAEYTILYQDGSFDIAYENALELLNESR